MLRLGSILAALFVAISAWLSQGTLAFGDLDSARVALIPTSASAVLVSAAAAALVLVLARRGASLAPLAVVVLPVLPWLPVPVPAAFLVWSGPLTLLVWLAIAASFLAASTVRVPPAIAKSPVAAGLVALMIYGIAAWRVAPIRPAGDEPHYLIITQSLLTDGDLRIENNHRRGDYRAYFSGDLSKPDYYRRGRNGEIYSVHAPGLAVLVLPAFAVAGYHGVVLFLLLISATSAGLAWYLAYRITGRIDAAWFGWAAAVFAAPMLLNAFTVYPDGPAALLVLTGVWALIRARDERTSGADSTFLWFLHGAALSALPWLHTRFALLVGGFGALVLLELARTKNPVAKASAFLATPAVGALAWLAFFIAIYGTPDPAVPYRGLDLGSPAYIPTGLAGLFFDQMYGLFTHAPALAAACCGFIPLARTRSAYRVLPLQLTFVFVPYIVTVTHFAMWWGGFSSAARFLVPLIPALAIPAAAAWSAARRGTRAVMLGAVAISTFISAVLVWVDRGRLAYYSRENVYALWLEWSNRIADLQHGAPAFFARLQRGQQPGALFFAEILVWVGVVLAAWLAVRAADRRGWLSSVVRLGTATALALAAAVMLALTVVWTFERVPGVTPGAQMDLLHAAASTRGAIVDLSARRRLAADELMRRLVVRLPARPAGSAGRDDRSRPLFTLPRVPAGEYGLSVDRRGPGGWLMVGIGRDQFALITQPVDAFSRQVRIRFPVDVRAIVVTGDEDARQQVGALRVQPIALFRDGQRVSGVMARRAVRYEPFDVFFLDDRSFPEPGAFWIAGRRTSSIVVQPDAPMPQATFLLRNAPTTNDVAIRTAGFNQSLHLGPGEERRIVVPLDAGRGATEITFNSASGFRPSEVEPTSRDDRFLGVWVRVERNSDSKADLR